MTPMRQAEYGLLSNYLVRNLVNWGDSSTNLLASVLEGLGAGIPTVAQAKGRRLP
jgi:hypothetical protein